MAHYYVPFEAVPYFFLISNHYFAYIFYKYLCCQHLIWTTLCALIVATVALSTSLHTVAVIRLWTHHFIIAYRDNSNSHFAYCIFSIMLSQLVNPAKKICTRYNSKFSAYYYFIYLFILFIYFFFCGINFDVNHFAASDSETMSQRLWYLMSLVWLPMAGIFFLMLPQNDQLEPVDEQLGGANIDRKLTVLFTMVMGFL